MTLTLGLHNSFTQPKLYFSNANGDISDYGAVNVVILNAVSAICICPMPRGSNDHMIYSTDPLCVAHLQGPPLCPQGPKAVPL